MVDGLAGQTDCNDTLTASHSMCLGGRNEVMDHMQEKEAIQN